jgi:hypothetical protein
MEPVEEILKEDSHHSEAEETEKQEETPNVIEDISDKKSNDDKKSEKDENVEEPAVISTPKGSHYDGTPSLKKTKIKAEDVSEAPNPDDDKSCCIIF